MIRRGLFLQLFGPQVLIMLASMSLVALYAWHASWTARREERLQVMYAQAELAAQAVFQDDGTPKPVEEIDRFCRAVRAAEGIRITVLLPDGRVLVETDAVAGDLPSHADRPEIRDALRTGWGYSDRYSATLSRQLFYAARAITRQGRTAGVVRVALPHEALGHDLAHASQGLWLLIVATIVLAALLSYLVAQRVVRPVAEMRGRVARIGAGELGIRLSIPHLPPLAELAHSINQTTDRLQDEIRALARERNLRERIVASMSEGVLATDLSNRVVVINAAACRLLNLGDRPVVGMAVCEWMRRADVLALLDAATDAVVERELLDPATPETALWARVSPLRDAGEVRIGTLMVLNDISHVRRLERVRQEFVANVSHELRTPITAIIGFAETLLDSKVRPDAATAERFLAIIRRQAGQLQSIITDLLLLSRLEDQRGGADMELTPLAGVVGNAVESCHAQAQAQQVEVRMAIPAELRVMAHAGLLEQAIGNLIQNAIQYGGSGGRVEVAAEELPDRGGVRVQVRDFGPGIAPEHLDRIFERFYRVDKGRSRHQGGTGLGLSIVKHVAQIHHGSVAVASELGKGCVFSLWLPPVEARGELLGVEPRMNAKARE